VAEKDRVHLQLLADYARVDYVRGHRLPRRPIARGLAPPALPGAPLPQQ
jgi:hypothetical protein